MTKKDYELIAGSIKSVAVDCYSDEEKELIKEVAASIAVDLWDENPKFDSDKFLQACGVVD